MKTKIVKVDEVKIESLIKRNFSEEFMRKVYNVYIDDCMSIVEKTIAFDKMFTAEFGNRKDYRRIGEGTNRFVCLLDNHIIKVAYNYLAYIDNMNELAQAKYKPKYLAQAYETNGIILVSEYVTVMDKSEFLENQTPIQNILMKLEADINPYEKEKGKNYILGDMGMSNKNYGNWGRRMNGEIVILDYGYLYELSYQEWRDVAKCPVCGSSLEYTPDYSELQCTHENCTTKVKYTTLRNTFGYANIIENIKYNLNNDKYIKFDEKGNIIVDVMEKIVIEDEPEEEFKMPEEEEARLSLSMEKFFELATYIKQQGEFSIDRIYKLKEEIFENAELYDEILLPCILGVLNVKYNHIDKYLRDFDKISKNRWSQLYVEHKRDFESDKPMFTDEEEEFVDYIDENEEYNVKGYESNIKLVDRFEDDEAKKITSLDDILGSSLDDCFSNIFMADDSDKLDKIENDDEYSLEHIMNLLNEETTMDDMKQEEGESEEITPLQNLEIMYNRLESGLTDVITNYYIGIGKLEDSESDYVTGDVYRTYLNGDFIDLDYSPKVNASNILGGYEPDTFAFPLYRHMLLMYDYDMEKVEEEYEATYRIDQSVEMPVDIYSKLENRSIVINQIMTRFEEGAPSKHVFVNTFGKELNDYYDALDEYYDSIHEADREVGYDDPNYYLESIGNNNDLNKLMDEAKTDLIDELLDQSMRLDDFNDTHRIVYYYDIEAIMSNTELNIFEIIKNMKFVNRHGVIFDNMKDRILNKYYEEYGTVLSDDAFDIFKYDGSIVKEVGCETHPRLVRPRLKAKLVPIDSNVDGYKPDVFNRNNYVRFIVEQRYEVLYNLDNPEDVTKMQDLKLELNRRNLYYTESKLRRYSLKTSLDNKRFALTDREVEILDEYERLLGISDVKDVDRVFKKAVVEILDREYEFGKETKEFMNDVAMYDLSEAFSNRLFKIHMLEMSNSMTRLEFLLQIEG